jgi:hypothetical protein
MKLFCWLGLIIMISLSFWLEGPGPDFRTMLIWGAGVYTGLFLSGLAIQLEKERGHDRN